MKKMFALVLALLMLCACGVEEEPVVEEEIFVADSDIGYIKDKIEIIESEDGKFGAKIRDSKVLEPIYDSIKIYDSFFLVKEEETFKIFDFIGNKIGYNYSNFYPVKGAAEDDDVWYIGVVSEGTMLVVSEDENREPFFEEVPDERHYLLNEDGRPFFDVPLENYEVMTEADEPGKIFVYGTAKGIRYEGWSEINGSERLMEMEETEPKTLVDEFGYEHTGFYANWYGGYMKHGLNINGEVFIEPVYAGLEVPFKDRIILKYGVFMQGENCGYSKIVDLDKNILSDEYNVISFIELENGYYVGVAVSYGDESEYPIFDKNGEPMQKGIWFIDKDGKKIGKTLSLVQKDDKFSYEGYRSLLEATPT